MVNQPKQLVVSLLVAVGVLTVVRDLLRISDRLRLQAELNDHPERLHEEVGEFLGLREEVDDGDSA